MKIWFNRGHSLNHLADSIRRDLPGAQILISTVNVGSFPGAHEVIREPEELGRDDYAAWCRQTIRERGVDLFIPERRKLELAGEAEWPCRVHFPADGVTMDMLDDKLQFAVDLAGDPLGPRTLHADSRRAFEGAVETLRSEGLEACVKPRRGVNGDGYWRLEKGDPYQQISDPGARRIDPELYSYALRRSEEVGGEIDLLVMEYLPGTEASVDVLAHEGRLLKAAIRIKDAPGRQRVQSRHEVRDEARRLIERYRLTGLVNVQFRRDRKRAWKALEINTRPAGGVTYADAIGMGLVRDWIGLLCNVVQPDQVDDPEISGTVLIRPKPVVA